MKIISVTFCLIWLLKKHFNFLCGKGDPLIGQHCSKGVLLQT